MAASVGFIALGGHLCQLIGQEALEMSEVMTRDCGEASGLLLEMNETYEKAAGLMCSVDCPCNLVNQPANMTLTVDAAFGAYSVEKCRNETSV